MVATTAPPLQAGSPSAGSVSVPVSDRPAQRLFSLRLKLGVLLGTVAALALAIPTVLHALVFIGDQERKVGEDNLELARVVGVLTEGRTDQTLRVLRVVTTEPGFATEVVNEDAGRLTDRLARAVSQDDDLTSMLIVDRDGRVLAHTMSDQRLVGQSLWGSPLLQRIVGTGSAGVASAIRSPITGRAIVPFAVAVRGADGEVVGAAVTYLSLDRLETSVNGARGPGRGLARIVDQQGRLLTSPDPSHQLSDVSTDNPVLVDALRGTSSMGRVESSTGGTVYAAALPLPGGWVVEVQHPVDAVLGPVRQGLLRTGLIALGAFALAMLVGGIAARRITEPLQELLRALRSIRREEGRPCLPRSSTAEVAWLADELEAMRSALETRTGETRHALDTLARYRLLAERTSDIVLFLDKHGVIVDLNAAAVNAHGYTADELIGRPIDSLVGDPEFGLTADERRQAREEGLRFETLHRRKDGTTFPVEVTLIGPGSRDRASTPLMMAVIRDVSARALAEAALRTSEARYRNVVDTIRDVVFQVDREDRWTFLNPAWSEITDFSVEETLGRRASEAIHPDDRERARALYRSLIGQQTSVARFEARYLTLSGGSRWLEIYANLSFGPDGEYLGSSGTLTDVTDRRHAEAVRARMQFREQEARASEERAAEITGIVQHMPCGVLVFDTDSCLTLANERALEMLSPTSAPGAEPFGPGAAPPPSALLDERLLNPCRVLVALALGGSVVSDRELQPDGPAADGRVLMGSAVPLRSTHGEVRGAVAILSDVTRERRLMHDLVHSEGSLRHSLESLLVLHQASQALGSTLLEEEIGRRLVESCVRVARLDAALLFVADDHGGVRLLGSHGDPVLIEHVLACPDEGRARAAALRHPLSNGKSAIRSCDELSLTAGHHIELAVRGRTLGVLEIYGTEQGADVTDDALASLAAHAVSAFENARLYREVGDREQRLQDALRQLLIAQEEERRRVAYELHDGLAQVAAATHLSLQTFASQYRPRAQQTRQQLERSVDLARRVVREARQVIAGLRPTTLDDFGLERALRLHVHELEGDGLTVAYEAQLGLDRLPGPIETVLYRIAQEALTNVRKHAGTPCAAVTLRRRDGRVELAVIDQGSGFKAAAPAADDDPGHHIGLVGMRERAALVGGRCVIESEPGQGTRVTVSIPLPSAPTLEEAALTTAGADHGNER
jgi:PAS domain S-box-containing protein